MNSSTALVGPSHATAGGRHPTAVAAEAAKRQQPLARQGRADASCNGEGNTGIFVAQAGGRHGRNSGTTRNPTLWRDTRSDSDRAGPKSRRWWCPLGARHGVPTPRGAGGKKGGGGGPPTQTAPAPRPAFPPPCPPHMPGNTSPPPLDATSSASTRHSRARAAGSRDTGAPPRGARAT